MRQADGLSEAFFYYGGTTPTPPTPSEDQNAILVTNEYVQKYLEEVTYKGIENEETKILGYPGGGPGEADIPPTHTIAWTADATAGALNLKVWDSDWSRDYSLPAGASEQGIKAELDLREASDVPSKSPMGDDIAFFAPGFESGYNHMIRDNKPKVKETFCFVVKCLRENKPVYFHCSAGRDRTGTLAVLLEGALTVSNRKLGKPR